MEQRTATHCNIATFCNTRGSTLQHTVSQVVAVFLRNALQHTATHCNTRCTTLQRNVSQVGAVVLVPFWQSHQHGGEASISLVEGIVCCSELQCIIVCCSVLQCVAMYCSVLSCVAVCCSPINTAARLACLSWKV